jgi:hypothetical protein
MELVGGQVGSIKPSSLPPLVSPLGKLQQKIGKVCHTATCSPYKLFKTEEVFSKIKMLRFLLVSSLTHYFVE